MRGAEQSASFRIKIKQNIEDLKKIKSVGGSKGSVVDSSVDSLIGLREYSVDDSG